jgi:hypothetical protein
MLGVASLLLVLTLGLLITRVATVALRATGLSHEEARFQARSAFSGVGFTTTESEDVVNHPVRRRIVLILMMLSGAGVVTALASLLLSFAHTSGVAQPAARIGALVLGLLVLWRVASSRWVDRQLSRFIEWALLRWTDLDLRDYVSLLHIHDDYSIAEIGVDRGDWLEGRLIRELHLAQEGVVVLGIHHPDGGYVGAPTGHTPIRDQDTIVVYGRSAALAELRDRKAGIAGDRAHERAAAEQRRVLERESPERWRPGLSHRKRHGHGQRHGTRRRLTR